MENLRNTILELMIAFSAFFGWTETEFKKQVDILEKENKESNKEEVSTVTKTLNELKKREVNSFPKAPPINIQKTEPKKEEKTISNNKLIPISENKNEEIVVINKKEITEKKSENAENFPKTVEEILAKIKSATINIFCRKIIKNGILKTTGSGVVISNTGVVLTNAHIAINLLLEEKNGFGTSGCEIRSGSPASKSFDAHVVFIPPSWAEKNKNIANNFSPTGTGEGDFAIIELDNPVNAEVLQKVSWLNLKNENLEKNKKYFLSGYPALSSSGNLLETSLFLLLEKVEISELINFKFSLSDAFGTTHTNLAHNGSSGGAVVNEEGNLVGIIVAITTDKQTLKNNIRGISVNYISKSLQKEIGKSLDEIIKNPETVRKNFEENLKAKVIKNILGN